MEILKENASVIQFATYNYCPFFHETTFILSTVANPLFQNNHKHPTVLRLTAPCNKRPYLSLSLKWACTVTHAHAHIPHTHTHMPCPHIRHTPSPSTHRRKVGGRKLKKTYLHLPKSIGTVKNKSLYIEGKNMFEYLQTIKLNLYNYYGKIKPV